MRETHIILITCEFFNSINKIKFILLPCLKKKYIIFIFKLYKFFYKLVRKIILRQSLIS
jgi:hypothetical protein